MRPLASAMTDDLLVLATRVHQRVGKDWHSLEGFVLVDAASHVDDVGGSPAGVECDGAEGVAEDVAEKLALNDLLCDQSTEVIS